jgi:hypothetical protein
VVDVGGNCRQLSGMANLTTWEVEKVGSFQGTATPGQVLGRAVDWTLDKAGKLPKVPRVEPNKDHWRTWAEGKPIAINEAWLDGMIRDGRLPGRDVARYRGNREDRAEMLAMSGSDVIVEMLDAVRRTRHRVHLARQRADCVA